MKKDSSSLTKRQGENLTLSQVNGGGARQYGERVVRARIQFAHHYFIDRVHSAISSSAE